MGTDLKADMMGGLSHNVGLTIVLLLFPLGVYILAVAADQLHTASRTAFAIAAPMVVVTNQSTAVAAPGVLRAAFKEISRTADRDALVDLTSNVDLGDGAAFAFQHVSAAQFTFCSHVHPSVSSIFLTTSTP